MNKKIFLSVLTISLALFLTITIVKAWEEPNNPPPGGNVAAPLNTSINAQSKSGALVVGSDLENTDDSLLVAHGKVGIGTTNPGAQLHLNDIYSAGGKNLLIGDDTYLTDIDTANMLGIYGNQNSDRAGIRLGSDGSYIFGDNGNVGVGDITPDSKLDVEGGDIRISTIGNGLIFPDGTKQTTAATGVNLQGWSFQNDKLLDDGENVIQTSDEWLRLNNSQNFSNGIYTPGKIRADGGLYVSDDEYFYRYNEDFIKTGDHFQSDLSVRAPIFYDSNNTGYYVNPAGTSILNTVKAQAFYYNSDRKLKEDIAILDDSLDKILKLEGVSFNWKENGEPSIGLIAQDIEKIFPEAVSGEEGSKAVNYGVLVAPLIESVKEQQKEIEELKKEIEELKAIIK